MQSKPNVVQRPTPCPEDNAFVSLPRIASALGALASEPASEPRAVLQFLGRVLEVAFHSPPAFASWLPGKLAIELARNGPDGVTLRFLDDGGAPPTLPQEGLRHYGSLRALADETRPRTGALLSTVFPYLELDRLVRVLEGDPALVSPAFVSLHADSVELMLLDYVEDLDTAPAQIVSAFDDEPTLITPRAFMIRECARVDAQRSSRVFDDDDTVIASPPCNLLHASRRDDQV